MNKPKKAKKKENWDCHDHREELLISDACTVYHPEHGQLCYVEDHWDGCLFHPIKFVSKAAAYKWTQEGYIADLQESLSILGVGFVLENLKRKKS